jgi:hypothetical protein
MGLFGEAPINTQGFKCGCGHPATDAETLNQVGIQHSGSRCFILVRWGYRLHFCGFGLGAGQLSLELLRFLALNGVESSVAFFAQADQIV